ncbi:MAG: ABC transporter permease [Phycisphaerales bacterium]|nr:ABC transporter permease [Phycisphaerales bacterium]
MGPLWRLAIRNWLAKPLRTTGAILAIALGTGSVVWVTSSYEAVRQAVFEWAGDYVGAAHITVSALGGRYDFVPETFAKQLAQMPDVAAVTTTMSVRTEVLSWPKRVSGSIEVPLRKPEGLPEIDLIGIDAEHESAFRDHGSKIVAGRMFGSEDGFACVLEARVAEEWGLDLGDELLIWTDASVEPWKLNIVGLVDRRRIGALQAGMALMRLSAVQRMRVAFGQVSSIDVMMKDASPDGLARGASQIRMAARRIPGARVRTAEARMNQIEFAQSQQRLVLVILSCVSMLTALFIILSTLSMGMIERVRQLGLLRCVGVTRGQLARMTLIEVAPIGAIGIALGVPIGLALTLMTHYLAPDYVGRFTVSGSGVLLAVVAGVVTTLVAAALPAIAALRVAPLEATRPSARPTRFLPVLAVGVVGLGLLAMQQFLIVGELQRDRWFLTSASMAVVSLYFAFALFTPLLVRIAAASAVYVAAATLKTPARLLMDQVGHAVWRSAGICCGLMVGLSLIIGIVVVNDSVRAGWKFPTQFPEGYLWSFEGLPPESEQRIASLPGVRELMAANALSVGVEERHILNKVQMSMTWFLAVNPDTFMNMTRLEFLEGSAEEAIPKLRSGGYVIIAEDFARSRKKTVGDRVRIWLTETRPAEFTVAAVVESPALDIAATYFELQTQYAVAASGSVLGTLADLKRMTGGVDERRLFLLNFNRPTEPPPADWTPKSWMLAANGIEPGATLSDEQRATLWRQQYERDTLNKACELVRLPSSHAGSVSSLKREIDRQLTRTTSLLAIAPAMALVIAALGVANLMGANVASRSRQLAILRAVGATRWLVLRLVIGEALVLGIVGSGLGVLLGMRLAGDIAVLLDRMYGFVIDITLPWGYLGMAIGLTVGLCLIAGVTPARRAARTNIVDALHVA